MLVTEDKEGSVCERRSCECALNEGHITSSSPPVFETLHVHVHVTRSCKGIDPSLLFFILNLLVRN